MERNELTVAAGEKATAISSAVAELVYNTSNIEQAKAEGRYLVEHRGPRDEVRDEYVALLAEIAILRAMGKDDEADVLHARAESMVEFKGEYDITNLVLTAGKNYLLDNGLAGSAFTATWYIFLIDGASAPTIAAGDTAASHAGWTENTAYSNSTRIAAAWSAASGGSKALSSAAAFNINTNSQTIAGCGIWTVSTKGGSTGTVYSAGTFSGGNKAVNNGDTLNVSYTASL